jgi:hypothetical protein
VSNQEDSDFGIVLFHSVQGAIKAEKILINAKVSYKLIPVPLQFSSNCGFCLRFTWSDRDPVTALLGSDPSIESVARLRYAK